MRRWTWMVVVGSAMAASLLPPPVAAQSSDAVGVVTTIDGRATVARPALAEPARPQVQGRRVRARPHQHRRRTPSCGCCWAARRSSPCASSPRSRSARSRAARWSPSPTARSVLAVAKQRMRPGESIEIRTPNAVAAVRGSFIFGRLRRSPELTDRHLPRRRLHLPARGRRHEPAPARAGRQERAGRARLGQAERNAAFDVRTSTPPSPAPEKTFYGCSRSRRARPCGSPQFVNTGTPCPAAADSDRSTGGTTVRFAPDQLATTGSSRRMRSRPPADGWPHRDRRWRDWRDGGTPAEDRVCIVNGGFETG